MPGGIPMVWVVFGFFAFVLWALTTQPDTLLALLVTPVWFLILGTAWLILRRRPAHLARFAAFQDALRAEDIAVREQSSRLLQEKESVKA